MCYNPTIIHPGVKNWADTPLMFNLKYFIMIGIILKKKMYTNPETEKITRSFVIAGSQSDALVSEEDYNNFSEGEMVILNSRKLKTKAGVWFTLVDIIKIPKGL